MMNYEIPVSFSSGAEMLEYLKHHDLYCRDSEEYVFLYNEAGSICVYSVDTEEADRLSALAEEHNEYWGAFLGCGGYIYDDPGCEFYSEDLETNLDFCNRSYNQTWYITSEW